jgi:ketosteroid isomerase-like protein
LSQAELVRRFYSSFNAEDLDEFVATLHPHVELQTARGLRIGLAEARAWATRNPAGGLHQQVEVEELREHHNHVVAMVRKQWWWKDPRELAEDEPTAALFTFQDGLIARWQPYTDRGEALRAAGIGSDSDPATQPPQ